MRVELTPAFILHRRAYRETSLLVDAYTRDHGRIGLVARGARARKSRWRGLLEPLRWVRLSWSGRGELRTLVEVDAEPGPPPAYPGEALHAGFYASELLLRLTAREDPHPKLFDAMAALLGALAAGRGPGAPLRVFERDLLTTIGTLPSLVRSDDGEPVRAGAGYVYHPEHGIRRDAAGAPGEVAVSGRALLALAAGQLADSEDERGARRLLAAAVRAQLHGRPLRTAETLRALRRMRDTSDTRE